VNGESDQGGRYNYMLLRFAPGTAARSEQQLRELLMKQGCTDPTCLRSDSRPAEIDGYRSARRLPLAIGIVLVLLLVATLAHVLVSTMRRRSDDLAILRALGCTPRNLVTTMRWQSLVLTSIAIVIGIPCGLVANRVAWAAFSRQLGIATGTVAPLATLAVGAAGLLVLALVLATAVGLRVLGVTRRHRLAT
jgi:predicted lysophospholipase L1 biosynthesis ABC-type transport system permease subunit